MAGDVTGVVNDGPVPDVDIDHQVDTGTLTVHYTGFASEAHGVSLVETCVGTRPGRDDLVPYSSQGVISSEEEDTETIG